MENIAAVILAAGEASRMGHPKQLLKIGDQTLVQRSIQTVQAVPCDQVVVVVGAHADQVQESLRDSAITCVHNEAWEEGMGSSIRTGVSAVGRLYPNVELIIMLLCDQPLVTPQLLRQFITVHTVTRHALVVSEYESVQGVPALFHRSLFPWLLSLSGSAGARTFIRQYTEGVAVVPFPEGKYDVDTPQEYEYIKRMICSAP